MKFELFVALRYLRAKRKQAVVSVITVISIVGVTAGVAALIVALALNSGFQEEFQRRILGATSHVNVLGAGGMRLFGYQQVLEQVESHPEVLAASPSIYGQCLLKSGGRQEPAVLKGIDPERAAVFADLIGKLIEGDLDGFETQEGVAPIILGRDLANSLVVSVGEYVRAIGLEGELSPLGRMPRIRNFKVTGIFESGLWEYDANWALIPIVPAQQFFSYRSDEVSAVELRIEDIYEAGRIAEELKEQLGSGYSTSTWIQLNRPLFSALRLEKLAMFVAIGLIIFVASLNIISTLTMMVMEKSRDIAILNAMGGTPQIMTRVFMLQGLIIGVIGTVIGATVGVASAWYCDTYQVFALEPQVYSIPYVPFRLHVYDVLMVSGAALLISFLATLYPARSAARLDPVEAIRYE